MRHAYYGFSFQDAGDDLVARGLTNAAIASRLGITERTVKGHLSSIFAALGVGDRTSAALWAQRNLRDGQG